MLNAHVLDRQRGKESRPNIQMNSLAPSDCLADCLWLKDAHKEHYKKMKLILLFTDIITGVLGCVLSALSSISVVISQTGNQSVTSPNQQLPIDITLICIGVVIGACVVIKNAYDVNNLISKDIKAITRYTLLAEKAQRTKHPDRITSTLAIYQEDFLIFLPEQKNKLPQ